MTRIFLPSMKRMLSLIPFCSGGAGTASISVLNLALSRNRYLAEFLDKAQTEGRISAYNREFADGYVSLSFETVCRDDTGLFDGIDAVLGGFRLLTEHFPEYVEAEL